MTAPFVTQLRARGTALQLAGAGEPTITVRVEMPEVWDTVKAVVSPSQSVLALKTAALAALYPTGDPVGDFVLKHQGWEVLDASVSLAAAGATDGSIFLLTHRRRRPVR
ncbi:MAG: hypothetical protein H7247_16445 [Polaromonas sp.]|nr:hypothetical protein [Gemmatimonadaceae bacterium]